MLVRWMHSNSKSWHCFPTTRKAALAISRCLYQRLSNFTSNHSSSKQHRQCIVTLKRVWYIAMQVSLQHSSPHLVPHMLQHIVISRHTATEADDTQRRADWLTRYVLLHQPQDGAVYSVNWKCNNVEPALHCVYRNTGDIACIPYIYSGWVFRR